MKYWQIFYSWLAKAIASPMQFTYKCNSLANLNLKTLLKNYSLAILCSKTLPKNHSSVGRLAILTCQSIYKNYTTLLTLNYNINKVWE